MPLLTQLLECHINVDVCFTVNIFMYLYKYLFKGPDQAKFIVEGEEEPFNEFEDYINARYLSSSEAVWRILNFDITNKSPSVISLSVHLPNRNLGQMHRKKQAPSKSSQLLQYFARPRTPPFSNLTFTEFFSLYRHECWKGNQQLRPNLEWLENLLPGETIHRRKIIRRTQNPIIARLEPLPPRLGELFYLRSLVAHCSSYCFQDYRTVHGNVYNTFQEAARALGLFDHETEAEQVIQEAILNFYCPSQLRFLFANLLQDLITPAMELWSKYKQNLCADFLQTMDQLHSEKKGLFQISTYLAARGSSLSAHGLPYSTNRQREVEVELEAFQHRQDT